MGVSTTDQLIQLCSCQFGFLHVDSMICLWAGGINQNFEGEHSHYWIWKAAKIIAEHKSLEGSQIWDSILWLPPNPPNAVGGSSISSIRSRNVEGALIHFMEGHQCGLPLSTKIRCYVGWFCIFHQDFWEFVTNDPKEKQVMIFFTFSWRWLPVTKFYWWESISLADVQPPIPPRILRPS